MRRLAQGIDEIKGRVVVDYKSHKLEKNRTRATVGGD